MVESRKRPRRAASPPDDMRWHLTAFQQQRLAHIVGARNPELVERIEGAVRHYQWWMAQPKGRAVTPQRLKRHYSSLGKTAKKLETLLRKDGDYMIFQEASDSMEMRRLLRITRNKCDQISRMRTKKGTGTREALALDNRVAVALQEAGIELTKSRVGILGRCVRLVRRAAGAPVPKDIFDAVEDCYKWARGG